MTNSVYYVTNKNVRITRVKRNQTNTQMKNQIILILSFAISQVAFTQDVEKSPKFKFQGGLWAGANNTTSLVGVPAAKLSATFAVTKKTKIEAGLMLIPGLIVDGAGERLGLSAGGTVIIRRDNWKIKPVIGVVFLKTSTWQVMPGVGFLF